MKKKWISMFIALAISMSVFAQLPRVSGGSIRRFAAFPSKHVQPRTVDVWLPDGYDPARNYPVLYMHDGQMLFDSTTTWNRQEWQVDETASRLIKEGKIKEVIIAGVWNNGAWRHADYFPQEPLSYLPAALRDTLVHEELMNEPRSDNYLRFLTQELKPFIDSTFSTLTDRDNTFIAGSSMGGLISLYALCEYPDVFGGAACLSTHWPGGLKQNNNLIPEAFNRYVSKKLPSPSAHKIYFDYGTETLDSLYKPWQLLIDGTVKSKGYSGKNWITREFTGTDHSEGAWAKRLHIPLLFLLGKESGNINNKKSKR